MVDSRTSVSSCTCTVIESADGAIGNGSSATTLHSASKSNSSPVPPESTTPACFKTGSCSGVKASASFARSRAERTSSINVSQCARAPSAAARAIESMVPSTMRTTAWRARTSAFSSDSANRSADTSPFSGNFATRPRSIWERMTPELPRAPIKEPWAMALQTSDISASSARGPSSAATDSMVSVMLVPVSPSGTG